MTSQDILDYCLAKPGAYLDYPFGEEPACVRVRAGNRTPIFVQIHDDDQRFMVTLKCDPYEALMYRSTYPGTVRRGYYCPPCQQPYWNTVDIDGTVPEEELYMMFDHAWERVISELPKYLQRQFMG